MILTSVYIRERAVVLVSRYLPILCHVTSFCTMSPQYVPCHPSMYHVTPVCTMSPQSVPCHPSMYHVTPVCTMSPQYVPSTWQMCGEARSWGRSRYGRLYGRPIKVVLWLCWYYIYVENNRCNTYQLETQHLINGTDLTYQRATKTTPCHTCIHEALPKWMTIHELPR